LGGLSSKYTNLGANLDADLSWHKGIKNTGKDAEVYAPQSGPNGLIKCEVARDVSTLAHR
jgi:urate oxidase